MKKRSYVFIHCTDSSGCICYWYNLIEESITDPALGIPLIIKDIEEGLAEVHTMKRKAKETILSVNCKKNYKYHLNMAFCNLTKHHN
ncbi:hypothetical protein [Arcticibacter eurypsychrophilus]|uniref:hypothetical protein n=1 Tax=Arcticibacter eurypsychrophilus TaxID=1434752 RepID=UPI00084E06FE|nr:hypothetical protein [Arcticibacter eurypsychrophilus]